MIRSGSRRNRKVMSDSWPRPPSPAFYGSTGITSEFSKSSFNDRMSIGSPAPLSPPILNELDFDINNELETPESPEIRGDTAHKRTLVDERVDYNTDFQTDRHRTLSTMTTSSKINKRFSVQPQPPSPTGNAVETMMSNCDPQTTVTEVAGEEPGINVDTMDVDIPDGVGSQVTIVDYCERDCQISHYDIPDGSDSVISGSSDRRMLGRRLDEALVERPSWGRVRWIVVNGLSWEAIRPIAIMYNIHPLALEDMLDIPQRTKVNVFHDQVFCCFPLHTLHITPTPFSLLHGLARRCVLKLYRFFIGIRVISRFIRELFVAFIKLLELWFNGVHRGSNEDAEQQHASEAICSAHSLDNSVSSCETNSTMKCKSRSVPFAAYASSKWSDSSATLIEEEECVPFYTTKFGSLCSNVEETPVGKLLSDLPARSMYEWNRGNLALHNEALQNMRIRGSANSVEIALEQVSLFLLPNTVITIFEKSAATVFDPIRNRLMSPSTILRQSSDASFLVQAIFDTNVDLMSPILHEYRSQLSRLQVEGIHQPNLRHTRALHALMTDLTMMRTLIRSIASLVDALRSKNVMAQLGRKGIGAVAQRTQDPPERLISASASEYLTDVADHAKAYLEDLDAMYSQSQTLNSLIFDTISIRAGDSVKMLSLVSVIFLPLTFLTGYFGMNFKSFTILDHDVGYYWLVSAPAAAALTVILMYPTIISQLQGWWSWAKLQV